MGKTLGCLILSLAGLAWAGGEYTSAQLAARFYYDLGPAEVDVSAYPQKQQENYRLFAKTCSQCHTLARPINSPYVVRKTWKRYVERMHIRTKSVSSATIREEDEDAIVDFLSYDAQIRKVKNKTAWETKRSELRDLYEGVVKERSRIQSEEDRKKIKPLPLDSGMGVKPSAGH